VVRDVTAAGRFGVDSTSIGDQLEKPGLDLTVE
jgi:hypothetical protein